MNTTTFEQTLTAAKLQDCNNRRPVENGRCARGEIERISKGSTTPQPFLPQWSKSGVNRAQSRLIADNLKIVISNLTPMTPVCSCMSFIRSTLPRGHALETTGSRYLGGTLLCLTMLVSSLPAFASLILLLAGILSVTAQTPIAGSANTPDRNRPGPWDNDVLVYRVLTGSEPRKLATFERAGVPTIARLQDGRLIAAFQNFPQDDNRNFDRVAVRFSSDEGRTWTSPEPIVVEDMEPELARPFDPTLVPLPDGRVRLYFTSNRSPDFRRSTPRIYSAISTNGIHYVFEPGARFGVEGRIVIDCAVALHHGVFHLIAPDNGSAGDFMAGPQRGEQPPGGSGYHAVSLDGLIFKRLADVKLSSPRARWLGNLQSEGGKLVFFGTGPGPWPVTSEDGATWEPGAASFQVPGADPGAVKLRDGSWLLLVTGEPRQGTPSARMAPRRSAALPPGSAPRNTNSEPPELERRVALDAGDTNAPLLFCIGLHIEPFGATVSKRAGGEVTTSGRPPGPPPGQARLRPDYHQRPFFMRQVADIRELARVVERHGGKMTVQAQTPFTSVAAETGQTVLHDLEQRGHEIALHFHEEAHLGRNSERPDAAVWAAVMREEIEAIQQAGVTNRIRYWSGGNLYPGVLAAAAKAGLDVMSDHKNPRRQQTDERLLGVNPWRPAGGPSADDLDAFARHDPAGKIIYLPDGKFSRVDHAGMRRSEQTGGDWKYFDFLTDGLEMSLRAARADRVNVFHITFHAGEFRGQVGQPFAVINAWLSEVVAPLVQAGKVRWASFSEMADAYVRWENTNRAAPAEVRSSAVPESSVHPDQRGYITFAVNCHDWRFVDESADTLLRLISIFEKHAVRGDFYLTAPLVERYVEKRPDVVQRLKQSQMTISYHTRAPHPLWRGFSASIADQQGPALAGVLRDYETFLLDLRTGGLNRERSGGYRYVEEVFGRKPVAVGASDAGPDVKRASSRVYADLGARVAVFHHETGTKLEQPFEFRDGLLARPSDFSITRFTSPDNPQGVFWWNMMGTPRASEFDPVVSLDRQLKEWQGNRAPFITALIHENDFYREAGPGWNAIYFTGQGAQAKPRRAPFDLDTPPTGRARSTETREAIFRKYEELVARAAATLRVVTSEDIAALAQVPQAGGMPSTPAVSPLGAAVAGTQNRRSTETPQRAEPGSLAPFESVFIRIPSRVAGREGIAASVVVPRQPRFTNGAPVVINVTGGVQAGSARGRPEYVGHGFIEIHFAFPGGGQGNERSGGTYDFRGPNCIRALADVIRFATGRSSNQEGRCIGELVRDFPVLTNNVGIVGSSHGGNACGLAMAKYGGEFPDLAWYASMESPYGEGAANVELGGHESGLNPAYDPRTGVVDFSKLAWSDELSPGLFRKPMLVATHEMKGAFYFDLNADGLFSRNDDFPCNCFVADAGNGVKAWYSPRIIAAAEARKLIRGKSPAHVPGLAEAREFWSWRDAAPVIPEAVRQCTNLAVIVYANERDHVQADPAHSHILEQVEGFRRAGARFVRLNPDRAYVEHLASPRPPRLSGAAAFPDNLAGQAWTRANITNGLEPSALPLGLYMQAAVCELADRTHAGQWRSNLDSVLFPKAPRVFLPLLARPPSPGSRFK